MNDKIYITGLFVKKPNEKAPEFVIAKCSIDSAKLTEFINNHTNAKGYLNFDIKSGQKGYYAELDTWQPKTKSGGMTEDEPIDLPEEDEEINVENIPF